jgi:CRISPR-associated endonuclease Cas2
MILQAKGVIMQNYLICYDISNKKRLSKVKKIAYSYALGGQKSAVEAPLDKKLLIELIDRLKKVIKESDKVNIIAYSGEPICFGKANFIEFDKGVIIV